MTLKLTRVDHGDLCKGWAWTIEDEDILAESVARILLGQYLHIAAILDGVGEPGPKTTVEQAKATIKRMSLAQGDDPSNRDGLLFQTISWIAAKQQPSAALTRMPHIIPSQKGLDGLQLELNEDGTAVIAAVIFEDKATINPRDTIREDVWPCFKEFEMGERQPDLIHEISGTLYAERKANSKLDIYAALSNTVWNEARRYRVSITIGDTHNTSETRLGLFKGFNEAVSGDVIRRRADTIYLPMLREWMNDFASLVIDKIKVIANVRSNN